MLNILYLPGLLGSNLGYDTGMGPPPQDIWLDPASLATGGAVHLQLATDGVSAGPLAEGVGVYPTSLVSAVYAPFGVYLLGLGHNLCVGVYDWRQSVITQAATVLSQAQQWFHGEPFCILGHSQGGLLARAVWKLMFLSGADTQLQRLVTICTPQWGSMAASQFLSDYGLMYAGIVGATAWPPTVLGPAGPEYIDAVVASWPGIYELIPCLTGGPLSLIDPAVAKSLYQVDYYASGNRYVTSSMLETAINSQEWLLDAIPTGRMSAIIGTGESTCLLPSGRGTPQMASGYIDGRDGDGTVSVAAATLPGVPTFTIQGAHVTMMLRPDVWAVAMYYLNGGS